MDVAVELMRTGVNKATDKVQVENHCQRFSKQYKRWKDSSALLIFQLTGDDRHIIVPQSKRIFNYTFVYEMNSLYKGKQLLKRGAISLLPTPSRRDFSTSARPLLRVHVADHGRAVLRFGYGVLKRFH